VHNNTAATIRSSEMPRFGDASDRSGLPGALQGGGYGDPFIRIRWFNALNKEILGGDSRGIEEDEAPFIRRLVANYAREAVKSLAKMPAIVDRR
jgi:hypothetical protein